MCLYINHCGILRPLSPTTSTYSARKTPENTADDPQPADEVDTQMQYSSDCLCSPSIGAVTKTNFKNLVSYQTITSSYTD
jgi:hypothetical protein